MQMGSNLEKAISPTDQSSGSKVAVYKPGSSLFMSLGQTFPVPLIVPPHHLWYSSHPHDIVKIVNVPLKFSTRTKLIFTCCQPHSVKWWPLHVDDFALEQQPKTAGIVKVPITLCSVPPGHSCTKHCSPFEYSLLLFGICWLYSFFCLPFLILIETKNEAGNIAIYIAQCIIITDSSKVFLLFCFLFTSHPHSLFSLHEGIYCKVSVVSD